MVVSRVASLSRWLGLAAIALFVGVPALIQVGLMNSAIGFPIFGLGGVIGGLAALVLGVIGLVRTSPSGGRGGRQHAITGTTLGALIVGITLAVSGPGMGVPPINDVTTDPNDPPAFAAALQETPNRGRDMGYPAEFAAQQLEGYPDLASIEVEDPPAEALDRVVRLVEDLGWELIGRDDATRSVEATQTSRIFGFVDDVVVRVRPGEGGGSIIDVRSKSREGRSDLGANAAKIRQLRDGLR